jgi:tRNA1(Val) A37 N6-methylase TrmN6
MYIICNLAAVLSSCIGKVARTGTGAGAGGLLLLAACTDCPLLLVQQARKLMSQPAECSVN